MGERIPRTLQSTYDKNRDGVIDSEALPEIAAQANSVAADVATLVTDFNALLAKLRASGYMAQ
jgi:Ca2+-binding EF-hand superfamily protein